MSIYFYHFFLNFEHFEITDIFFKNKRRCQKLKKMRNLNRSDNNFENSFEMISAQFLILQVLQDSSLFYNKLI